MNKCLNCNKEISERAKTCSDRCRIAYGRRTKKGEQPEQNDPILKPEHRSVTKSDTDKLFEDLRPGYYVYDDAMYKKNCVLCGKDFETQMQLLRFCSPEHQRQIMVVIANGPNSKFKP